MALWAAKGRRATQTCTHAFFPHHLEHSWDFFQSLIVIWGQKNQIFLFQWFSTRLCLGPPVPAVVGPHLPLMGSGGGPSPLSTAPGEQIVTEGLSKPSSPPQRARTWCCAHMETLPEPGVDAGYPRPCRKKSANKRRDCSKDRSSHKKKTHPLNASWAGICLLLRAVLCI